MPRRLEKRLAFVVPTTGPVANLVERFRELLPDQPRCTARPNAAARFRDLVLASRQDGWSPPVSATRLADSDTARVIVFATIRDPPIRHRRCVGYRRGPTVVFREFERRRQRVQPPAKCPGLGTHRKDERMDIVNRHGTTDGGRASGTQSKPID